MASNLEVKARLASPSAAERTALRIGAVKADTLHHTDTYFGLDEGRLKLRHIRGVRSELIWYSRADAEGTDGRWSSYVVVPVNSKGSVAAQLAAAYGVRLTVSKRRVLYLLDNARIHVDRVEQLGNFLEFEVVENKGRKQAERLFRHLMTEFSIRKEDTIAGSYVDLLGKVLASKVTNSYII